MHVRDDSKFSQFLYENTIQMKINRNEWNEIL